MSRLSTPRINWLLSSGDFTLSLFSTAITLPVMVRQKLPSPLLSASFARTSEPVTHSYFLLLGSDAIPLCPALYPEYQRQLRLEQRNIVCQAGCRFARIR